ncbi:MAG: coproporphyrinogen-III oxidase family protein [Nanoarchaeota archaeon]|nr:coproporphyrinogen-III oxidase family protein [Nanoarchaeota archaeon]
MYKNLILSAKKKLKRLKPIINRLNALGIHKTSEMGNKSSHIVVTYPPIHKLKSVNNKNIYSGDLKNSNTLYIHIPFCSGVCTYCNYSRTAISGQDKKIVEYLELLNKEAEMLCNAFSEERINVDSIYIGGGTPTMLNETNLGRLFEIINQHYVLKYDGEYTLEASPETVTVGKTTLAHDYGVNRVSLGIESFNDPALKSIDRRHNSKDALKSLRKVRKGGINNVDFDLIRNLPGYTPKMMIEDIKGVNITKPESINSNNYTIKPGSTDERRFNEMGINQEEQLLLHLIFVTGMKQLGYFQKPVDWFIKSQKHVYRHQILKWEKMANQLVLGLSAYGYIHDVQFINYRNLKDYKESIMNGRLPLERATRLSKEEIMRRSFIFGLKTKIDNNEFERIYGIDPIIGPFKNTLNKFVEAGGIENSGSEIKLTEAGSLFADWIQMAFYSNDVGR